MANTRNNPLEDLAVHLPMICDRYELRDDVPQMSTRAPGSAPSANRAPRYLSGHADRLVVLSVLR